MKVAFSIIVLLQVDALALKKNLVFMQDQSTFVNIIVMPQMSSLFLSNN